MIVGIVILSVVVATAIGLVGHKHLNKVAPAFDVDLGRVRARLSTLTPAAQPFASPAVPGVTIELPLAWQPEAKLWTAQLADDADEQRMLAELRARPSDELLRMVYSDWLEDRGVLDQAAFVRGSERIADRPVLAASTSITWRAVVSRGPVACAYPCPGRWELLDPVPDDERARRCPCCGKIARYLDDLGKMRSCQNRGEIPVMDFACTLPARPMLPFDLSSS